jgi:ribosomal protein S18 acetylase RimI-like enzyme
MIRSTSETDKRRTVISYSDDSENTEIEVPIEIRFMHRMDLATIGQIEELCFADPWLPEVIAWSIARQEASGLVATIENIVVGYAIYKLEGGQDDAHIWLQRLAVHPRMRRCGIGEMLLDAVEDRLTIVRRRLVLPVRESNLDAQLFLKTQLVECREIKEDYFADGEAAYMFELSYEPEDFR